MLGSGVIAEHNHFGWLQCGGSVASPIILSRRVPRDPSSSTTRGETESEGNYIDDSRFSLDKREGVSYYRRVTSKTAHGLNLPYEVFYDD